MRFQKCGCGLLLGRGGLVLFFLVVASNSFSQSPANKNWTSDEFIRPSPSTGFAESLLSSFSWTGDALRIELECQPVLGTLYDERDQPATADTAETFRTIIDFYRSGQIRELRFDQRDGIPGNLPEFPDFEAVFDGHRVLMMERDPHDGTAIVLSPRPTVTEAVGVRGMGMVLVLGLTPGQTEKEWDIFSLVRSSGVTVTQSSENSHWTELTSDTPAGLVKIAGRDNPTQIVSVSIFASRPHDFLFGVPLSKAKVRTATTTYSRFEYPGVESNEPSTSHFPRAWHYRHKREYTDGRTYDYTYDVRVTNIQQIKDPPPDTRLPNQLVSQFPDGTPVILLDNANIEFVWQNGMAQKKIPSGIEDSIRTLIASWKRSDMLVGKEDVFYRCEDISGLCGIISLYAAVCWHELNLPFETIYEPDYCSTGFGSTTSELVAASTACGLNAEVISGLGLGELATLDSPSILHVRAKGHSDAFAHWVLFLNRTEQGLYAVFDPAYGIEYWRANELISRSDGTAIVLNANNETRNPAQAIFWYRIRYSLVWGFLLGAVVWTVNHGVSRKGLASWIWFGCLVTVAIGWQTLRSDGVLSNRQHLIRRLAAMSDLQIPRVSVERFSQIVDSPNDNTILVDARYAKDYQYGTLGKAINYPINLAGDNEQSVLESLRGNKPIVVFCQSAGCPFSDIIARRLRFAGCQDVSVFEGGVQAWLSEKGD